MFRAMQRWGWSAVAIGVLLLSASAASAQVLTTGALTIRAVDESNRQPLREVLVTASADGARTLTGSTDANGVMRFVFVTPGEYTLTAERLGYAPKQIEILSVRPGAETAAVVQLTGVAEAAQAVVVERYAAASGATGSPGSVWVSAPVVDGLPMPERALADLARLSPVADDGFGTEGLPASLSSIRFDGVEVGRGAAGSAGLVPLASIQTAELLTNPLDVVWGGAAGGILSAQARRAAADTEVGARATWSGDALPGSGIEYDPGYSDLRGEMSARGPIGAAGGYALTIDARRAAQPLSAAWASGATSDALVTFGDANSADFRTYVAPSLRERTLISASGAFDVPLARAHELGGRVLVSSASAGDTEAVAVGDVMNLTGIAHVRSRFGTATWNQLQLALTSSTSEHDAPEFAPLTLVPDGMTTVALPDTRNRKRTSIQAQDVFGYRAGAHDLQAGFAAGFGSYSYEGPRAAAGEYYFGGLDELTAGTGVLVRTEGEEPPAEWTSVEYSLFAQDRWRAAPGVELLIGARIDGETLPREEVSVDTTWFRLTGALNNVLEPPAVRVSPRIGLSWTPNDDSDWLLEIGAGIYHDRFDPLLLAEWQTHDGADSVLRAVGNVGWPTGAAAGVSATRLTVFGQDFAAPRTVRLHGGVTGALGDRTVIGATATLRRTDNLPRRTDLNLLPAPTARDQYGRGVFGTLVKQGGLLAEMPGTSRRFAGYDEVSAISGDGESDYWGVTLALDHDATDALALLARYTFSRTEDNWFGARAGWYSARPAGIAEDDSWVEGTSDFDVPHRAVVGAVMSVPFGLRVSALYRAQSGLPFTPTFRAGVDANADGDPRNDPAFVDPDLPGMSEVIGRWTCLGESSGAFAERNGCRTDMVHTLDASAALRLFTAGRMSTSLVVDAFDLLDAERTLPDAALYLLDPASPLGVDNGTVSVPLVVNPDFGMPRTYAHTSRSVRIGLTLSW